MEMADVLLGARVRGCLLLANLAAALNRRLAGRGRGMKPAPLARLMPYRALAAGRRPSGDANYAAIANSRSCLGIPCALGLSR
jgi:hypothetical protein